jgi:RimJ/RimL family protein N-acetyltransferase
MSRLIVTPRLVLRPWQPADAPAATRIYADPMVTRWLTAHPAVQRIHDIQAQLTRWSHEDDAESVDGHWAVAERSSAAVVGAVTLQYFPAGGESLTINWALASSAQGQGYAAEAGDGLVRWAFHQGNALEVFALIQPDNTRSRATAERIGMEWVAERGDLAVPEVLELYRIRHGDLGYEDEERLPAPASEHADRHS